MVNMRNNHCNG
jgi:hypothetical protein